MRRTKSQRLLIIDTFRDPISELLELRSVGIFDNLGDLASIYGGVLGDFFAEKTMAIDYYLNYSGKKKISNLFETAIKNYDDGYSREHPDTVISNVIWIKYSDKWRKILEAFYSNYDIDDEFSTERKREANNVDDIITSSDGETNTNVETHMQTRNMDSVYGYNSTVAVPQSTFSSDVSGDSDENHEKVVNINSATEKKTMGRDETETYSGRHNSMPDIIEKEIKFRDKRILWNIIFDDIDSVATIGMY